MTVCGSISETSVSLFSPLLCSSLAPFTFVSHAPLCVTCPVVQFIQLKFSLFLCSDLLLMSVVSSAFTASLAGIVSRSVQGVLPRYRRGFWDGNVCL